MVARNSSGVVAPIRRISPRASCGFSMFAASIAPSAAPAPTMVCSSSINKMTLPCSEASARQFLSRSSKSPRYFAPDSNAGRSSANSCICCKDSGTSPCKIFLAMPSTIAVFPTPASPIRQGLFLVRLERMRIICCNSFSRPISGS